MRQPHTAQPAVTTQQCVFVIRPVAKLDRQIVVCENGVTAMASRQAKPEFVFHRPSTALLRGADLLPVCPLLLLLLPVLPHTPVRY